MSCLESLGLVHDQPRWQWCFNAANNEFFRFGATRRITEQQIAGLSSSGISELDVETSLAATDY